LPALDQLPEELAQVDDRERSLDEVVLDYDPTDARERFGELGWHAHHSRSFEVPPSQQVDPDSIEGVYASVDAFGSSATASDALDYIVTHHVTGEDHEEVDVSDELGGSARALYGEREYGNEMTIYAVRDDMVIRLSVSSREGDPRAVAISVMKALLSD
jgi:hypothetical protein